MYRITRYSLYKYIFIIKEILFIEVKKIAIKTLPLNKLLSEKPLFKRRGRDEAKSFFR